MWRDMERICRKHGTALQRPTNFPRNGLLAARVAQIALDQGWGPDFVRAVYTANFAEDREIGEEPVIAEIVASLERDADEVLAQALAPGEQGAPEAHRRGGEPSRHLRRAELRRRRRAVLGQRPAGGRAGVGEARLNARAPAVDAPDRVGPAASTADAGSCGQWPPTPSPGGVERSCSATRRRRTLRWILPAQSRPRSGVRCRRSSTREGRTCGDPALARRSSLIARLPRRARHPAREGACARQGVMPRR